MPREKVPALCWKFMTVVDKTRARCNICSKVLTRAKDEESTKKSGAGTSNLNRHLERTHKDTWAEAGAERKRVSKKKHRKPYRSCDIIALLFSIVLYTVQQDPP
jgi:hypothetical protein